MRGGYYFDDDDIPEVEDECRFWDNIVLVMLFVVSPILFFVVFMIVEAIIEWW